MSNFSERLCELLAERELSTEKVAAELNVSIQTVYDWKAGNQQIYLANLINLCELLNCSIDFLAGRSDIILDFKPVKPAPFQNAIKEIMQFKGISTYQLRKDTRYDGSYFARWHRGSEPYLSTLIELADYFQCTIDELVGREKLSCKKI